MILGCALVSILMVCATLNYISYYIYDDVNVDTEEVREYCSNNNYSTDYCFLVDFSKPSGVDRFYIYDFKQDKVIYSSLCAHGLGKNYNIFKTTFSNTIDSNYSSLGKYEVGNLRKMRSPKRKVGYTLYGLEETNSNALKRGILIHDGNPEFHMFPLPCLPMSQGCFAVSHSMMQEIEKIKNKTNKPILLYAYN